MYLDIRHLRCLLTIHQAGNLARAADQLHLTQSALSHQIKSLENHFSIELFLRNSKPLRLTPAGLRLLDVAKQVLPLLENAEREVNKLAAGHSGRLHISIDCHACFEWLRPVFERYRQCWPEVELDLRLGMSFDPIPVLQKGDVDVVITSDPVEFPGIQFEPLFPYEARLVMSLKHPLCNKTFITPRDLAEQTLITYPVKRERLDIFKYFLQPAQIEPANHRQVELSGAILLLVASDRGVAALPDWVLQEPGYAASLASRPLGEHGLTRTLYAAIRQTDSDTGFIKDFIGLARQPESLK